MRFFHPYLRRLEECLPIKLTGRGCTHLINNNHSSLCNQSRFHDQLQNNAFCQQLCHQLTINSKVSNGYMPIGYGQLCMAAATDVYELQRSDHHPSAQKAVFHKQYCSCGSPSGQCRVFNGRLLWAYRRLHWWASTRSLRGSCTSDPITKLSTLHSPPNSCVVVISITFSRF